ncbi:hypothetical protein Bbelb_080580 [Branchiostoma belcheri]|nr:hypothetical protein Bbelb_080580 [Branchiostoma belcheri]
MTRGVVAPQTTRVYLITRATYHMNFVTPACLDHEISKRELQLQYHNKPLGGAKSNQFHVIKRLEARRARVAKTVDALETRQNLAAGRRQSKSVRFVSFLKVVLQSHKNRYQEHKLASVSKAKKRVRFSIPVDPGSEGRRSVFTEAYGNADGIGMYRTVSDDYHLRTESYGFGSTQTRLISVYLRLKSINSFDCYNIGRYTVPGVDCPDTEEVGFQ